MSVAARNDYVSNAKLRREYLRQVEAGRLTATEMATRLGWWRKDRPDTTRLLRVLGLKMSYSTHTGKPMVQRTVHVDSVGAFCEALRVLPTEIGY